jgi:hypothetical protein
VGAASTLVSPLKPPQNLTKGDPIEKIRNRT